jgi:predicted dinucleotide-binding enzyme
MAKHIGVLGSGQVAQVLAAGFAKDGYQVRMGTRDAAKLADFAAKHRVAVVSGEEAAKGADLVVLAVKGTVAEAVVRSVAGALAGKTVIDVCNPIADLPPVNGVVQYFTSPNESLMERLQNAVPAAHFVKAWNSVGNAYMIHPSFPNGKPTMFICGNNAEAKVQVGDILRRFDWDVADMGFVESARAIEPLCQLWCIPGILHGEWRHAFALLKA